MSRTPNILFLTPFHFGSPEKCDTFDSMVTPHLSGPDVTTTAEHVDHFDPTETGYDSRQSDAVIAAVERANDRDIDAIVVACHYDPAVPAARAAANVPVIAPLQLVAGLARQFGPSFAVITDIEEAEDVIGALVQSYGHGEACVDVRSIGWEGDQILDDTAGAARVVDSIVADLVAQHDIQSVVIGCTIVSMAYERHRADFPDRGVTILDSNLLSVRAAAALAAGHAATSRS